MAVEVQVTDWKRYLGYIALVGGLASGVIAIYGIYQKYKD